MTGTPCTWRQGWLLLSLVALSGCGEDPARGGNGAPVVPPPAASPADTGGEGKWDREAALHRSRALALGPGKWDAELKEAMVAYLMADRVEEARKLAEECLARNPSGAEVLYYLGDGQRVLKHYPEARETLSRFVAARPSDLRGAFSLAHVQLRLGNAEAALPLLERVLAEGAPAGVPRPLALVELARALRRLGRKEEAADRIAEALEEFPYDLVALAEGAQIFASTGRAELAKGLRTLHAALFERGHQVSVEDETKLHATGPTSDAGELRLALQAADRRELLLAFRELQRLHSRDPGDVDIAGSLARLAVRLFRYNEALRLIQDVREKGAEAAELARTEADVFLALGDQERSRASLLRASALAHELPRAQGAALGGALNVYLEIHRRAADAALAVGDQTGAAGCLERARALAPGSWSALWIQGRIELAQGLGNEALKSFEAARAASGSPAHPPAELRRWNGVARGLAGDLQLSAREIVALIKEEPQERLNFEAFARIFGRKAGVAEVDRVLALERQLAQKLSARDAAARAAAGLPLESAGPAYLELGHALAQLGQGDRAVDAYLLSAELDSHGTEPLLAAANLLGAPQESFVRLQLLRRALEREPGRPEALDALARTYLLLGLRLQTAERLAEDLAARRPGPGSTQLLESVRTARRG